MAWQDKINAIQNAGIGIYDELPDEYLYLTNEELQEALSDHLIGYFLAGYPLRTRSKVLKTAICEALRMTPPASFRRCHPRFPNQNFDPYSQKSTNLQIWNEGIVPSRRYAVFRLDDNSVIDAVRVISGFDLAQLDTTGTLTQKYQARVCAPWADVVFYSQTDLLPVADGDIDLSGSSPLALPQAETLMPIRQIAERLLPVIGWEFDYIGTDQERNRGAALHARVCSLLGYPEYKDNGGFPDIKNQLLELKLQTSSTIDLGLYSPADTSATEYTINGRRVHHDEVRYGVFSASIVGEKARIQGIAIGYGREFYARFPQTRGQTINRKIQIPLPADFFNN